MNGTDNIKLDHVAYRVKDRHKTTKDLMNSTKGL